MARDCPPNATREADDAAPPVAQCTDAVQRARDACTVVSAKGTNGSLCSLQVSPCDLQGEQRSDVMYVHSV